MIHEPYVGVLEHLEGVSVLTEVVILCVISAVSGMRARTPLPKWQEQELQNATRSIRRTGSSNLRSVGTRW